MKNGIQRFFFCVLICKIIFSFCVCFVRLVLESACISLAACVTLFKPYRILQECKKILAVCTKLQAFLLNFIYKIIILINAFFIFAGIFALFANNLRINIRKTPLGMLALSGLYVNIFCYAVSHSGLFCNDKINFYDNEE